MVKDTKTSEETPVDGPSDPQDNTQASIDLKRKLDQDDTVDAQEKKTKANEEEEEEAAAAAATTTTTTTTTSEDSDKIKSTEKEDGSTNGTNSSSSTNVFAAYMSSKSPFSSIGDSGASPFASFAASSASPFAQVKGSGIGFGSSSDGTKQDQDQDKNDKSTENGQEDENDTKVFGSKGSGQDESEVNVATGEEDEENIIKLRGKLYRLALVENEKTEGKDEGEGEGEEGKGQDTQSTSETDTKQEKEEEKTTDKPKQYAYKELGAGVVRVNVPRSGIEGRSPRIIMRREGVLTLILNALVWDEMPVQKASSKMIRFTCKSHIDNPNLASSDGLDTFLLKLRRDEECEELWEAIEKARIKSKELKK